MTTGHYIAFEGLEGCGKSTHVTRLAEALGGIATREPGGTAIGASLRAAMLDASNTMLSPRAEALMMSADRAQHLDELVLPTLRAGKHVVSDRSAFSSLAYQGYGRMLDIEELKRFNNWAIAGNWPASDVGGGPDGRQNVEVHLPRAPGRRGPDRVPAGR